MRIDYEYLKNILEVFLDSPLPTVGWDSFKPFHTTLEEQHKFAFHLEVLADKDLVRSTAADGSFGIGCDDLTGYYSLGTLWRLTADGHDFAAALEKPQVLDAIKARFRDEGISAVIDIAKQLAESQLKKLLPDT